MLSSQDAKLALLPSLWNAITAIAWFTIPAGTRSGLSDDLPTPSGALLALGYPTLSSACKSVVKRVSGLLTSVRKHASMVHTDDGLDGLCTTLLDGAMALPFGSADFAKQGVMAAASSLIQHYVSSTLVAAAASTQHPTQELSHATSLMLSQCIDVCIQVFEHALLGKEFVGRFVAASWWSLLRVATDGFVSLCKEPASLEALLNKLLSLFQALSLQQLQLLQESPDALHVDSMLVLPVTDGVDTQNWVPQLLYVVGRLLVAPSIAQLRTDSSSTSLTNAVLHTIVRWLELAMSTPGVASPVGSSSTASFAVFRDPLHSIVLLTFASHFDAAVDAVVDDTSPDAQADAKAAVAQLRSELKVLYDSCFLIRSRSLIGMLGADASHDDSIAESLRVLFRLTQRLKPSASLTLLDAMQRLYSVLSAAPSPNPAVSPPAIGHRRSVTSSAGFDAANAPPVNTNFDPLCAAYAAAAGAMIVHRMWQHVATGTLSPREDFPVAGVDFKRVIDAYVSALGAAAHVYEDSLVEALVSACHDLSMAIARDSGKFSEGTAPLPSSWRGLLEQLEASCQAAVKRVRGLDKLMAMFYAVYFVGPAFSEVSMLLMLLVVFHAFPCDFEVVELCPQAERDRWYVYRAHDTGAGLEMVNHLAKMYPEASVQCVDSPITVGCVDARLMSRAPVTDAGTSSSDSHTIPRTDSSGSRTRGDGVVEPVYQSPYVFLGAGSYGVAGHCQVTSTVGGLKCEHVAPPLSVVTQPSHIYVYPAVLLHSEGGALSEFGSSSGSKHTPSAARNPAPRFRLWVSRNMTRYVAPADSAAVAVKANVLQHPMTFDGPCISREFDESMPVDTLLTLPDASAVVCIDLQLQPELTSFAPSLPVGHDALSTLTCPWLTRRCPVSHVHVRPVGLADACQHWQDWANALLVNRIRWAYSVSIRSENPADGATLWPAKHQRRASLLSEPQPGSFGAVDGGQHWGGTKRASMLAAQMPPKYRQLIRSDAGVRAVAAHSSVWAELAAVVGMEAALHNSIAADSLDSIDIAADNIPLSLPVLHRKRDIAPKKKSDGEPMQAAVPGTEFIVQDLGDDGNAAASLSGGVYGVERVANGSHAAEVVYAAVMDVCHPKLSFAVGLRVIRLLLNDYR